MQDIALIQMRSGMDVAANIAALEQLVGEAVAKGAHYIQTPEMTGLVSRKRENLFAQVKKQEDDLVLSAAQMLAKKHHITLHIGSTAILNDNDKVANRAFVIGPKGDILAQYDKLHMFDVDLDNGESWRESAIYQAGDCAQLCKIDHVNFGLGICYDLRFAEFFAQLALAGAEVLTVPAAFTRQTGEAHWHVLLRARAIETGCFVLAAAQGGTHEDGRETYGHSLVVDPWGKVIAEKADDEPGVLMAKIDIADVLKARGKIPNLRHRRDFDIKGASQ